MEIDFTKEDILRYWKSIDDFMDRNGMDADYPYVEVEIIHKFIIQTLENSKNG